LADDVIEQSAPSAALPIRRVKLSPLAGALRTQAEPVSVMVKEPMEPKSSRLFTATTETEAGEAATVPS
jgi:hypothetical protein